MVLRMVLETDRLPNIVQDFLKCSEILRRLIANAILDITEDIKIMVYDRESKHSSTTQVLLLNTCSLDSS